MLDSIKAEHPNLPGKFARKASRWVGADKKISGKLKPGSKAWLAGRQKKAEELAARHRALQKRALRDAAAAKMLHSLKVKVGMAKKKWGLADEHLFFAPGNDMPGLDTAGMDDYLKRKGVNTATPDEKAAIYTATPLTDAEPVLVAQMHALDELVVVKLAQQATTRARAAKAIVAKAAHAIKVKTGLARKKYGVKKVWTFTPGKSPPVLTVDGAGLWAKQRGIDWDTNDWSKMIARFDELKGPGVAPLAAQMQAMEEIAITKLAHPKVAQVHTAQGKAAYAKWSHLKGVESDILDSADYSHLPGWTPHPTKSQSYGTIIFDDEGRVLMREPKGHFGGAHWTFAKGGGDLPGGTALKELGEETGHIGSIHNLIEEGFEGSTTKTNYFLGRSVGFDHTLMDAETKATKWMTYDEAIKGIAMSSDPKVVTRDTKVLMAAYKALGVDDAAFAKIAIDGMEAQAKAQVAAGKAAHSHKVKLGMAQKHYAKPKFGGGVVDGDWFDPFSKTKLGPSGVDKVLSEKGWHSATLPPSAMRQITAAEDVVAQKAIMDGLKKAPKGTTPPPVVAKVTATLDPDAAKAYLKEAYPLSDDGPIEHVLKGVLAEPTYAAQLKKLEEEAAWANPLTAAWKKKLKGEKVTLTGPGVGVELIDEAKLLQWFADEHGGMSQMFIDDMVKVVAGKTTLAAQLDELAPIVGALKQADLDKLVVIQPPTGAVAENIDIPTLKAVLKKAWKQGAPNDASLDWWVKDILKAKGAAAQLEKLDGLTPGYTLQSGTKKKLLGKGPVQLDPDPLIGKAEFWTEVTGLDDDGSGVIDLWKTEQWFKKLGYPKTQIEDMLDIISDGGDAFYPTVEALKVYAKKHPYPTPGVARAVVEKRIDKAALKDLLLAQGSSPTKVPSFVDDAVLMGSYDEIVAYLKGSTFLTDKDIANITSTAGKPLKKAVKAKATKGRTVPAFEPPPAPTPTPAVTPPPPPAPAVAGSRTGTGIFGPVQTHTEDEFFDSWLASAKTVSFHADDGKYNETTLATFAAKVKKVDEALAKGGLDADTTTMLTHYSRAAEAIYEAQRTKKPLMVGFVKKFEYRPEISPPKVGEIVPVGKSGWAGRSTYKDTGTPLGGSTGAKKVVVQEPGLQGRTSEWVLKDYSGRSLQAENEYLANGIYNLAQPGSAPASRLGMIQNRNGDVSVGVFNEFKGGGKELGKLKGAARKAAENKAREGFVLDAWLANWDSVGLSGDNMMVLAGNKVVRIDNGGALLFRAQGGLKGKEFGNKVVELKSLLDARKNPSASKVYKGLTDLQIAGQIEALEEAVQAQGGLPNFLAKAGLDDVADPAQQEAIRAALTARFADLSQVRDKIEGIHRIPMGQRVQRIKEVQVPKTNTTVHTKKDVANDSVKKVAATIPAAQKDAIRYFTGSSYLDYNRKHLEIIRKGKKSGKSVAQINNGLAKLPGFKGTLGRGQSGVSADQWNKWKSGDWAQVWWTCPSSTSARPNNVFGSGQGGVCYIVRSKGKRNAYVQSISSHHGEHEALFMGDSLFQVAAYAEDGHAVGGHFRFLVIDELPDGAVPPTKQAAPPKLKAAELWEAFKNDATRAEMGGGGKKTGESVTELLERSL